MRSRYIYSGGKVIYAQVGDAVLVNELPPVQDAGYYVMPDIAPHKNMYTGEIVNSRSRHREILRDHGLIEIGNEMKHLNKPRSDELPKGVREELARQVHQRLKY